MNGPTLPILAPASRLSHKALGLAILAMVLTTTILQWVDRPLRTPAAPNSIVSFELARDPERAQAVLASWDPSARVWAGFGLGIDYLYMLLYANALAHLLLWTGRRLSPAQAGIPRWSLLLAWGMWLAALFDATENLALLAQLLGRSAAFLPLLAWSCAVIKFGLLGLGGAAILAGLAGRLLRRL